VHKVSLGRLSVSAQGLGCMGMSEFYGPANWDESIGTIRRALDLGVTLIDTADIYGAGLVPYSPLGRGFLTGTVDVTAMDASDFRSRNPRFTGSAGAANQAITGAVRGSASRSSRFPAPNG
jgi:aryl-alcohol dehydrogenase-like predicted oxidoreductase